MSLRGAGIRSKARQYRDAMGHSGLPRRKRLIWTYGTAQLQIQSLGNRMCLSIPTVGPRIGKTDSVQLSFKGDRRLRANQHIVGTRRTRGWMLAAPLEAPHPQPS